MIGILTVVLVLHAFDYIDGGGGGGGGGLSLPLPIPHGQMEVCFGAVPTYDITRDDYMIHDYDDQVLNPVTNSTNDTTAIPAAGDGEVQNINITRTRTPSSMVLNTMRAVLYIASTSRIRSLDRATKYVATLFYDPYRYRPFCLVWRPPYLYVSFSEVVFISKIDMTKIRDVAFVGDLIPVVGSVALIKMYPYAQNISNVPSNRMRLVDVRYFDEYANVLYVPDVVNCVIHRASLVSNFVSFLFPTYAYDIKYHRGYLLYTSKSIGFSTFENVVLRMSAVNPQPHVYIGTLTGRAGINGTAGFLQLAQPRCLALSCTSNHLYISMVFRVVKYSFIHRNFSVVAGTDRNQFNTPGPALATTINLKSPYGLGLGWDEVYIADETFQLVFVLGDTASPPANDLLQGCENRTRTSDETMTTNKITSLNTTNATTAPKVLSRNNAGGGMSSGAKAVRSTVMPLAAVSVMAAAGTTAMHSARIGTLIRLSNCEEFNDDRNDPSKHPTTSKLEVDVESEEIEYSAGMFVTNAGISVGFVLLHYIVVVCVYCKGSQPTMRRAKSVFGYPQFSVAVPAFFLQSIVSSSLHTCMHAQTVGFRALGAVVFILSVFIPILFVWYVTIHSFHSRYESIPFPQEQYNATTGSLQRFWLTYAYESGEWVDKVGHDGFTAQYRVVYSDYRTERVWYGVIEVTSTAAFGVLDAWTAPTDQECVLLSVSLLVLCVVVTILLVLLNPYHTRSAHVVTLMLYLFFLGSSIVTFVSNVLSSNKNDAETTVEDTGNLIILWGAVATVGGKLITMVSRMGKTCRKDHNQTPRGGTTLQDEEGMVELNLNGTGPSTQNGKVTKPTTRKSFPGEKRLEDPLL